MSIELVAAEPPSLIVPEANKLLHAFPKAPIALALFVLGVIELAICAFSVSVSAEESPSVVFPSLDSAPSLEVPDEYTSLKAAAEPPMSAALFDAG